MAYTVLARRYRSRTFDEVIGQSAVAQTLQHALETNRVGHAYLFCGTRGVGKTTMARLFAAAINLNEDASDSSEIRDAIMRGDDLDVIEIDGASNRGVQEARDLIANAGLSPTRSPHKIYIIDEVHMLTTESFNTLLKTMEEPPEHVKFILCTTEPKKVLPTIQSRCQRFDFKPIPSTLIVDHLAEVVSREGATADRAVIARVAELGNGSMRDALSVLERLLASGRENLDLSTVDQVLGLPNQEMVGQVLTGILDHDPAAALQALGALVDSGTSLEQAVSSLVDQFRSLLLITTCGRDTDLIEATDAAREALSAQAAHLNTEGVLFLLSLCEHASRSMRLSSSSRAVVDATVVRMALADKVADIAGLLEGNAPPESSSQKKTVDRVTSVPPVKTPPAPRDAAESGLRSASRERSGGDGGLAALWSRVLQEFSSASTLAKLAGLEPLNLSEGVLRVKAKDGDGVFLRSQEPSLSEVFSAAADAPIRVKVEVTEPPSGPSSVPSAGVDQIADASRDPVVQLARDLLDGVVVDVHVHGVNPESTRSD